MNLTPEELKQNAAAMIAFAEGKPIEFWDTIDKQWFHTDNIEDINIIMHRPKPEPKTRLWSSRNDLPVGCIWLRAKGQTDCATTVSAVNPKGVWCFNHDEEGKKFIPWERIAKLEWSHSPGAEKWNECEVIGG